MRFTTWSTLINAFVISTVTVALLSLISAADALYIHITEPGSSGEIVLVNSTETFEWCVPKGGDREGKHDWSLQVHHSAEPRCFLRLRQVDPDECQRLQLCVRWYLPLDLGHAPCGG
jgi:hypothetical protein